eukprot:GFKZ01007324.1.p1 GENE.GFKZ01007324.1~~GFKZ01007324.1.p1  ORF type:complete len:541 (+),score=48.63 GFKZ01007324.1:139-1623(+)
MPDIPQPVLPNPEISHVLNDIFTLCRTPFVYDFIFAADLVADISILTSPVQIEHAIAAHISLSGTENTASFAHVFDFSTDLHFSAIPAFSVGAITLGFATLEPTPTNGLPACLNPLSTTPRVQCNRYVRDDDKGIFLMFSDNPHTGLTEIDCITHCSTRQRRRVCARFHTASLRSRLCTPRGVLHPQDVVTALSYLSVATERRACLVCCKSDESECGCRLPFVRPAHPLDFRNERRNMRLHTGLYEGGSTVRLFSSALPFVITSLTTRSVIKGSLDREVIGRLNRFAVQDRMGRLRVSPFGGVVGLGGEETVMDPFTMQTPSLSGWSFRDGVGGLKDAVSLLVGSDESRESELSVKGGVKVGDDAGNEDMEVCEERDAGGDGSQQSDKGAGVAGGMVDKAERRRQRNREAAAKSNLKRKIRNETLRRNLKQAKDEVEALTAREKQLREENVKLRGLAAQHKYRVSEHLTHIQVSIAGDEAEGRRFGLGGLGRCE